MPSRENWRQRYAEKLRHYIAIHSDRVIDLPSVEEVVEQSGDLREEDLFQLEQLAMESGLEERKSMDELKEEAKREISDDDAWAMVLDGQRP